MTDFQPGDVVFYTPYSGELIEIITGVELKSVYSKDKKGYEEKTPKILMGLVCTSFRKRL